MAHTLDQLRARTHAKILIVFHEMPGRFHATDLYVRAAIRVRHGERWIISDILRESFKCQSIKTFEGNLWVKPGAHIAPHTPVSKCVMPNQQAISAARAANKTAKQEGAKKSSECKKLVFNMLGQALPVMVGTSTSVLSKQKYKKNA